MQLDALFKPKSIAIVGASDKPTPGRRIIASLDRLGFAGRIYPVNPNYAAVLNRTCYPRVADLPEAPDIGVFCLGLLPYTLFNLLLRRFAATPASRCAAPTAWAFSTRTTKARPICRSCAIPPALPAMSVSSRIAAGSASAY